MKHSEEAWETKLSASPCKHRGFSDDLRRNVQLRAGQTTTWRRHQHRWLGMVAAICVIIAGVSVSRFVSIKPQPIHPSNTQQHLATAQPQQQPQDQPSSPPGKPVSFAKAAVLQMLNQHDGWAVLGLKHLIHTTDGGKTWTDVTPKYVTTKGDNLLARDFLDERHAWLAPLTAKSDNQNKNQLVRVIYTADGGNHWQTSQIHVPGRGQQAVAISFLNAQDGWLIVDHGVGTPEHGQQELYQTTDGGVHWHHVTSSDLTVHDVPGKMPANSQFIDFSTPKHGWLATMGGVGSGSGIWQTTDGGLHWQPANIPNSIHYGKETMKYNGVTNIHFFDAKNGLIAVDYYNWGYANIVYVTHDGGQHWTSSAPHYEQTLPTDGTSPGMFDFVDSTHGWFLGGDSLQSTTDGGTHWHAMALNDKFERIDFVNQKLGFASTVGGKLLQTTDGGRHWSNLHATMAVKIN